MTVPDKRPFYWQVWNSDLNGSLNFLSQPCTFFWSKENFHICPEISRNARNGPWRHWNVSKVMRVVEAAPRHAGSIVGCISITPSRSIFCIVALVLKKLRLRDGLKITFQNHFQALEKWHPEYVLLGFDTKFPTQFQARLKTSARLLLSTESDRKLLGYPQKK